MRDDYYPPYISTDQRRREAAAYVAKQKKRGKPCNPILPTSKRLLAETFWGKAWCKNLESQADLANRLERGRSYVRHGAVVHLEIEAGRVRARVQGSSVYDVDIRIKAMPEERWKLLVERCHGQVDSLLDLLNGTLSAAVMQTLTELGDGILPRAGEIKLHCSCPDGAIMCKHVAATLYGIGARLDTEQELLFVLRQVDPSALITQAAAGLDGVDGDNTLGGADLGALFDIDLGDDPAPVAVETAASKKKRVSGSTAKKAGGKKKVSAKMVIDIKVAAKKKTPTKKKTETKAATKKKPKTKVVAKKKVGAKATTKKALAGRQR